MLHRKIFPALLCLLLVIGVAGVLVSCDPISSHEHTFEEQSRTPATCTQPGEIVYACTGCSETKTETIPATGHAYGEWTVTTAPTCETPGVETRVCANDRSHTETRTVAPTGHAYGAWTVTTAPTCETPGVETRVCANDRSHTETRAVAPTEHAYAFDSYVWADDFTAKAKFVCANDPSHVRYEDAEVGSEITVPATCETPGVRTYTVTEGVSKTETIPSLGHQMTDAVTPATCTQQGYTTHSCSRCDYSYVDSYTALAAHSWDKPAATCTEGRSCSVCGATEAALGHHYVLSGSSFADCENPATETWTCDRCKDSHTDETAPALGHDIAGVSAVEVRVEGSCDYLLTYLCRRCEEAVSGETVTRHNYTAAITTPATCKTAGVKTLTCSDCGATATEEIPIDKQNGHAWDEGTLSGNIRTYTCSLCEQTKTVVDASAEVEAKVAKDDLQSTGEVQLKEAALALDETTLGLLGDDVTISADTLKDEDLEAAKASLSNEQLAQLGDSKIYNFTLESGSETISDFAGGKITVTIPYELSEGEDVDGIAIWYMSEGEPVSIRAEYANGFVTFEVEHFSYYTVTRLTPAQRCEVYGHNESRKVVAPTCTEAGYTLVVCLRCGQSEKTDVVPASGHTYDVATTPASCTENGSVIHTCTVCGYTYRETLRATGHSFSATQSADATCKAPGYVQYSCANCDAAYRDVLPQLAHRFTETVAAPTCEAGGYTEHTCSLCGESYRDALTAALGHDYRSVWQWSEDLTAASLTFVCAHDASHTFTLTAAIRTSVLTPGENSHGGTAYTASVIYNGDTLTDRKVVLNGEDAHDFSETYEYDGGYHWHSCVCGEKTAPEAHTFTLTEETKATCVEAGRKVYTCVCGATKEETVPATGVHTYENGVCTVCGAKQPSPDGECKHPNTEAVTIRFADYGFCGGEMPAHLCKDCGEYILLPEEVQSQPYTCVFDYSTAKQEQGEEEDGTPFMKMEAVCKVCGGMIRQYATLHTGEHCVQTQKIRIEFVKGDVNLSFLAEYSAQYHSGETPVTLDLSEYSSCGGSISYYACSACGDILRVGRMDIRCEEIGAEPEPTVFVDDDGVKHTVMEAVCPKCGLRFVEQMSEKTLNACVTKRTVGMAIYSGEDRIFFYEETQNNGSHQFETTYELLGESCEDGIRVTETCSVCGETSSYQTSGHRYQSGAVLDLSEFGGCGSSIPAKICSVCKAIKIDVRGYESFMKEFPSMITCDVMNAQPVVVEQSETAQIMEITCPTCGVTYRMAMTRVERNSCEWHREFSLSISKDGRPIAISEAVTFDYHNDHEYTYRYEMKGESCEDGYTAYAECAKCGETQTFSGNGHSNHLIEKIDLTRYGACGGTLLHYGCPCGYYNNWEISDGDHVMSWNSSEYRDENGKMHSVETRYCTVCGLRIQNDSCTVADPANCRKEITRRTIISIGAENLADSTRVFEEPDHDYLVEATLNDGVNCENGVTLRYICRRCGDEHTERISHHATYVAERIDLSEYGSVCGGYALYYRCACGREQYVNLDHALCDFDRRDVSLTVPGAINDSQNNENGYQYYRTESILYSCAVTDPQCAFRILSNIYYLPESGCCATRVEEWKFGYDPDTGSAERTITIRREKYGIWHSYRRQDVNTVENGLTVSGYLDTCTVCGNTCKELNYRNADGQTVKFLREIVNRLENGAVRYDLYSEEYMIARDHSWRTAEIRQSRYADGEEYSYERRYAYDFSNCTCTVTTVRSGSPEPAVYTESLHSSNYPNWHGTSQTVAPGGCTQERIEERYYYCDICDTRSDVRTYTYDPDGHDWTDIGDGLYVCMRCGLENTNGADGSIVLEDLTPDDGDSYVIGYWDKTNAQFLYYVALILRDAGEGENDEILLENIEIIRGSDPRAFSFSKAEVKAAAEALGYAEEEYDVRFVCVPYGADGSFDYAITLTDDDRTPVVTAGGVSVTAKVTSNQEAVIEIVPEKDGYWTITSVSSFDTVGGVLDENGEQIAWNDDGGLGNNFLIRDLYLSAGKSYSLHTKLYNDGFARYIVTFEQQVNGEAPVEPGEEDPCAHENAEVVRMIDLADYGCCGGVAAFGKCRDCGKEIYEVNIACETDLHEETPQYDDATGCYYGSLSCAECGLIQYFAFPVTEDGEPDLDRGYYQLIHDGEVIFEAPLRQLKF